MAKKIDTNLLRSYMMGAADPVRGSKSNSSMFGEEIDLHVDSKQFSGGKRDNKYAIEYQLEALETALDNAVMRGKAELRVIHGLGKGKLKEEVHKILAAHPQVKHFENAYHPRYGMGSTLVHFK
jgi:Smr domain